MYLLVALISQESVIYLHADFDSNAFNRNSQEGSEPPERRARGESQPALGKGGF